MSHDGPIDEKGTLELQQYIFSNVLSDTRLPSLLEMFYRGVFVNTIGIMCALDKRTDTDALLLVGVEDDGKGGVSTYPLARILDPAEVANYLSPDGLGGYFNDDRNQTVD